jgi:hypothetical protein
MPVTKFNRRDFSLRVRAEETGQVLLQLAWDNTRRTERLSSVELLAAMMADDVTSAIQSILSPLELFKEFERWRDWTRAQPSVKNEVSIGRMTLQVDEYALAGLPWEKHLREAVSANAWDLTLVRVSPVRPRVAQVPFTVPLRLLQIDPKEFDLSACIRACFYNFAEDELANTVRVDSGLVTDFVHHVAPKDWPMVDVLHLGSTATRPQSGIATLQTEDSSALGTLGWLTRVTEAWQTRLVVMEAGAAEEESRARTLAAALCARGGPAVLVGPSGNMDLRGGGTSFYTGFYRALIHDDPIDQAFAVGLRDYHPAAPPRQAIGELALFVGCGREELIRVSAPAEKLHDLAEALRSSDPAARTPRRARALVHHPGAWRELRRLVEQIPGVDPEPGEAARELALSQLRQERG